MSDLVAAVMQALQAQAARNRGFLSDAMAHALATVAIDTIRQHAEAGVRSPAASTPRVEGEETWERTGELRWCAESIDQPVQLQQALRCAEDGRVIWKNVPLVLEREAAATQE